MPTPTFKPLASITLATTDSEIIFSGIPQNFRDLYVSFECLLTSSGTYSVQLNGDGANHFSVVAMAHSNSNGINSNSTSNTGSLPLVTYTGTPTSGRVSAIVDILDYSATNRQKAVLYRMGGTHETGIGAGRWANTNAVTSVKISTPQAFVAGSTFSIFGIEG